MYQSKKYLGNNNYVEVDVLFRQRILFRRIKSIWDHRFADLRFVQMEHLTNRHGDPLFPQDTKERVYEQCRTAKNILLKVISLD